MFRFVLLAPALICAASAVYPQNFPAKPVRFVTSQPGGGADTAARIIAGGLAPLLGHPVVVDNRATGVIPGEVVSKSAPDGYTLLIFGGTHWLQPFFRDNVPYDPIRDFAPITIATTSPGVLVVHPSLPVKSVKELIALAKSRPGDINYASGGTGSANHLAAELFKTMAHVNLVQINYKGTGPAVAAVVSGEVQIMIANATSATPFIKSGRLKALAVASMQPSTLAPGLPTITSSGVPGFESASILGIFAPAKTPEAVVTRLNQDLVRFLKTPEARDRFFAAGSETVGSSPAELLATVKSEISRLGKIIRDNNIREQ